MKTEELKKILDDHKLWLECGSTGKRADLQGADLQNANLRNADLRNANLDFSCWPLWCGSLGVKIDDRLKIQLMYHMIDAIGADKFNKKQIDFANKFHRVGEAPKLEK